jgi:cation-transporting P-type ATPase C
MTLKQIRSKKIPIMKVVVVHNLPGRLRLKSKALLYLGRLKHEIVGGLLKCNALEKVIYTPQTGGLLIYYTEGLLSVEDVVEIVESHIGSYSLVAYQADRERSNALTVNERRLQDASPQDIAKRLGWSVGGLVLFGLKPRIIFGVFSGGSNILMNGPSILSILLSKDIFKSGFDSLIVSKRPNADTLTATALATALLTGRGLSALMTIMLSDIAEWMTAYTLSNTRGAIKAMLTSGDEEHFVQLPDGQLLLKPVNTIDIDEVVSVQTGDKLSVDGIIVEGDAYIDQAAITGEYYPVHRLNGQQVYAGTILKSGQLRVQVNRVGDNTTVARIVHMVEDATSKKARIQTYMDRFSAHLIPLNFAMATLMYVLTRDVNRALSMMIIDYSCGVRLSTATALSASIYNAAQNGVLIKGGNYIEGLAQADALVLDKTGTITEGRPKVTSVFVLDELSERDVISLACAAEEESSHPIAHAILQKAKSLGCSIPKHGLVEVEVGKGVMTSVEGATIRVGNRRYMKGFNIELTHFNTEVQGLEQHGETVVYIAKDNVCIGILGIHDSLKENMKRALNRLRNMGFDDVRLLTGDLAFQAEKVASRMHMDDFQAELMPEDKARTVLNMQAAGAKVIMIGDGINDAPALAYADVGIAMGNTRTDVAIESSSVTIINDDPLLIPSAVQLSRNTMRIIKENFAMVIGINSLGIALSAFGVIPVFWSSVLHNSSTILVVMNSGRLLVKDFERRRLT